jgi:hypothetical protein
VARDAPPEESDRIGRDGKSYSLRQRRLFLRLSLRFHSKSDASSFK